MTSAPVQPKASRAPWIIVGVLGCVVVCLLIAVVGAAGYLFIGKPQAPVAIYVTTPISPAFPTGFAVSTATTVAFPTALVPPTTQALPTLPIAVPSQAPVTATLAVTPTTAVAVSPTIAVSPTLSSLSGPAVSSGVTGTLPSTTALPAATPTATRPPATATPTAPTGKIAFSVRRGDRPEDYSIWTMNADGVGAKQIITRSQSPAFSPNGSQIAYYQMNDGIFVMNADGTQPKRILGETFSGYLDWSHDGRWIAFSTAQAGIGNVVIDEIPPDGSAMPSKDANGNAIPSTRRNITIGISPSWSPDDTMITFNTCRGSTCGIFKSSSAPGSEAIPVVGDDGGLAAWSPDGKRIVYQKEQDGGKQLFIINVDGSGKKQLTSGAAMHVSANWSGDGRYIYYRAPEGGVWGIYRINPDGSNPILLINDVPPADWAYERIAVTR